jgi:hypothetical protein
VPVVKSAMQAPAKRTRRPAQVVRQASPWLVRARTACRSWPASEVMPSRVAHVTQLAMGKANICGIRCVANTGNSETPAQNLICYLSARRGGP